VVTSPSTRRAAESLFARLRDQQRHVTVYSDIRAEPTVQMFRSALAAARDAQADTIAGLGGGSPMDVAKLVAALLDGKQEIRNVFGIDKLAPRRAHLVCLPATAGTGSEVSPNAILLDEDEHLKKGVISPPLSPRRRAWTR
jgi:alcohol dehydrogenase class IV